MAENTWGHALYELLLKAGIAETYASYINVIVMLILV